MWAGILMMLPSINAVNASGIKSMATDMAVAQGMGKGEFYTCETLSRFLGCPSSNALFVQRQLPGRDKLFCRLALSDR